MGGAGGGGGDVGSGGAIVGMGFDGVDVGDASGSSVGSGVGVSTKHHTYSDALLPPTTLIAIVNGTSGNRLASDHPAPAGTS